MPFTYNWPRPSLTVDAAIIAAAQRHIPPQLLLIKRKNPPCQHMWALPGGFVDEHEPLDAAAARELQEETGVNPASVLLKQVGAFGDPGRDPRGWCVTAAYTALVPTTQLGVKAAVWGGGHVGVCTSCVCTNNPTTHTQDDAAEAEWFPVQELPPLAFDHQIIVRACFRALTREKEVQEQGM